MQMDPFPGITALPDTLNPYLYTLNNPVNFIDPSGKFLFIPLLIAGLIGGFLGGVGYYSLGSLIHKTCWNPGEALAWGAGGAILGALLASLLYGGWWVGAQFGWWPAASIGSSIAAANEANAFEDFTDMQGANASQILARIPQGWTRAISPFTDKAGKLIDQVKYISPDELQELRIHAPVTGQVSYVARWAIQVPLDFYNNLPQAKQWLSAWNGTYWANLNNLGKWVPRLSDAAHIPVNISSIWELLR